MKKHIACFSMAIFILGGCVTPSPQEHLQVIHSRTEQVYDLKNLPLQNVAKELKYNDKTVAFLEDKDAVLELSGKTKERSYFKVFKFVPTATEQVVEVRSTPYKPTGFGQIGILYPVVFFYNSKGQQIKNPELVFYNYDTSFVDGQFIRGVWRLKSLEANQPAYVVIASKTEFAGKLTKPFTNYGGASVGVIFEQSVQFSPVGRFSVLQTDHFKK